MQTGYEFHRDELYYLECARRLSFGYVDHPALTPLFATLAIPDFGPVGLRWISALAHACMVWILVSTASALGATPRAQWLIGLAAVGVPIATGAGAIFGTVTFDLLACAGCLSLLALYAEHERPADALWACAVAGIGFNAKWTVLLPFGLAVLALAVQNRNLFPFKRVLAGMLVLTAFMVPSVGWQASHGWPIRELMSAIAAKTASETRIDHALQLLLLSGVGLIPCYILSAKSVRTERSCRFLAVSAAGCLAIVLIGGFKPYYASGAILGTLLPFAIMVDRAAPGRWLEGVVLVQAALTLVLALPWIPPSMLKSTPLLSVNPNLAETIGWYDFRSTIHSTLDELGVTRPLVVLTSNYGEAGALQEISRVKVRCGHNQYAFWPQPPIQPDEPCLATGYSADFLQRHFTNVMPVGEVSNRFGIENELNGKPIFLCIGLKSTDQALQEAMKHFD